jgi:ATP/maltotriose-dependent transcriptional regulator MalT
MTLVSAPAGFGKTTMVVTWLDELADDQTRIGWLSLDDKDNDPVRFLSYFVAALQTAEPQLGQTAVHLLQSPQPAAPEGYIRIFADEGEPMAQLLAELHDGRHPFIAYIHSLRQTFNQVPPPPPLPSGIDSLSEREMEVLHLIADGASNQEIAAALVVTISTVKKHVSNILSKLNTSSRTQAVAEARTLNLL